MIIPDGFSQINLFFTGVSMPRGGQVTFGTALDPSYTDPADAAAAAAVAWSDNVMPLCSSNITLDKVLCKFGPNEDGASAEVVVSVSGEVGESSIEPQCALLVSKNTALGGRKHRGRMFVPGVVDDAVNSGGVLIGDSVSLWQTAMNDTLTDLATAGLGMYLLHNDEATAPDLITTLTVNTLTATQRRRLRKVGGRRKVVVP